MQVESIKTTLPIVFPFPKRHALSIEAGLHNHQRIDLSKLLLVIVLCLDGCVIMQEFNVAANTCKAELLELK